MKKIFLIAAMMLLAPSISYGSNDSTQFEYTNPEITVNNPLRRSKPVVGHVIAMPNDSMIGSESNGWVLCNGQVLEKSKYPSLFRVIGYTYGGSGDYFNVPDYRGMFSRGYKSGITTGLGTKQIASAETYRGGSFKALSMDSNTGGGTDNPFASSTGGSHTVKVQQVRTFGKILSFGTRKNKSADVSWQHTLEYQYADGGDGTGDQVRPTNFPVAYYILAKGALPQSVMNGTYVPSTTTSVGNTADEIIPSTTSSSSVSNGIDATEIQNIINRERSKLGKAGDASYDADKARFLNDLENTIKSSTQANIYDNLDSLVSRWSDNTYGPGKYQTIFETFNPSDMWDSLVYPEVYEAKTMLEQAKSLQSQASSTGKCTAMPEDMIEFMQEHNLSYNTDGNDYLHFAPQWQEAINSLEEYYNICQECKKLDTYSRWLTRLDDQATSNTQVEGYTLTNQGRNGTYYIPDEMWNYLDSHKLILSAADTNNYESAAVVSNYSDQGTSAFNDGLRDHIQNPRDSAALQKCLKEYAEKITAKYESKNS